MTVLEPSNAVLAALQILSARNPRIYAHVRGEIESRTVNTLHDLGTARRFASAQIPAPMWRGCCIFVAASWNDGTRAALAARHPFQQRLSPAALVREDAECLSGMRCLSALPSCARASASAVGEDSHQGVGVGQGRLHARRAAALPRAVPNVQNVLICFSQQPRQDQRPLQRRPCRLRLHKPPPACPISRECRRDVEPAQRQRRTPLRPVAVEHARGHPREFLPAGRPRRTAAPDRPAHASRCAHGAGPTSSTVTWAGQAAGSRRPSRPSSARTLIRAMKADSAGDSGPGGALRP